jgi:hypothetical protein
LLGTSNSVETDWALGTYFSIDDEGNPKARFEVRDKLFGKNVLFTTDSYKELQKWFEEHSEEIKKQLEVKKTEWIEKYGKIVR